MRAMRAIKSEQLPHQSADSEASTNRMPPNPNSNRQKLKTRLAEAAGGSLLSSEKKDFQPLFAGARPRSIHSLTPLEKAGLEAARNEARAMLEHISRDPAFIESALEHARGMIAELPREGHIKPEELGLYTKKLSEFMAQTNISEAEKQAYIAECVDTIAKGTGVDALPDNPIARFLSAQGVLTRQTLAAEMTAEAREEVTKPNPNSYSARAALVFGAAAVGLGLEVGTTKTALIQLMDIYDPPGIKQLTSFISSQLQAHGHDPLSALSTARLGIATTIAGGVGGTLLVTKGLKNLSPAGKAAMYGSLGASLGLGYLALQNFVADNAAVAEMGKIISSEYKPIAEQGVSAKEKRAAAAVAAKAAVQKTLDAELNRKGAEGYGHFSAFLDVGLSGHFDESRFKTGSTQKHELLQAALKKLQKDAFGEEGADKGLLQLLAGIDDIDLTSAPASAEAMAKIGDVAASTTLWSGLGKVLSPMGTVTTPTAMYQQAASVTEAFKTMLGADSEQMTKISSNVDAWLAKMIETAKSQKADTNLVQSLENLRATLSSSLRPIETAQSAIEAAFSKLPKPSGKWVVRVGDSEFAQMQKTLEGTLFTTVLGFDLVKDSSYRAFYRGGIVGLLLLFFLTINYASKLGTNALYRKREGEFEGALHEGGEELNAKESALASGVARFLSIANKEFVVRSSSPELATVLPESVLAVYVRRRLRERFLEEMDASTPEDLKKSQSGLSWFVHGVFFTRTPEDVKTFLAYNSWLEHTIETLDSEGGSGELQSIVGSLFPAFDAVVAAQHDAFNVTPAKTPEKMKVFKNALRALRKEQLENLGAVIADRLSVIESTDDPQNMREGALIGLPRVRLDIDNTRTIVEPELVMQALARSYHSNERAELAETLAYIRRLGIAPAALSSGELRIGRFDLGPVYAIQDELTRIRAAGALGIPEATGQKEDFERFDAYMAEVATALREARDVALKQDEHLAPYTPVFEWEEGTQGKFTIRISIHPDAERIENPVAMITFPGTVPDFNKPDSRAASERLTSWLKPGSDAVRGLVAQERNAALRRRVADEFASVRRSNRGTPSLTLIEGSRKIALAPEIAEAQERIYLLQEIVREQESSLPLAREGLPIPEDKYQAFLTPEKYASNFRTFVSLSERFKDLQSRTWPDRTGIIYSPNERVFQLTFEEPSRLPGRGNIVKKTLSPSYTDADIEKIIAAVGTKD